MTNTQVKALLDNWDQICLEGRNTLMAMFATGTTVTPATFTIATRELTAPAAGVAAATLEFSDTLGAGSTIGIVLELDCG